MSNSWGDSSHSYDIDAYFVDLFLHQNQDMLNVQAAGNDGDTKEAGGHRGYGTNLSMGRSTGCITSPATSKNSVSVGATGSWSGKKQPETLVKMTVQLYGSSSTGSKDVSPYYKLENVIVHEWPINASMAGLVNMTVPVVLADPFNACEGLRNISLEGVAVLFERGGCTFTTKADVLMSASPFLGLMINSAPDSLLGRFMLMNNPENKTVPLLTMPFDVGRSLTNYLNKHFTATVTISSSHNIKDSAPHDNVAAYSSYGPTPDGRIKPDLVAPGSLVSAYTDWFTEDDSMGGFVSNESDQCRNTEMLQAARLSQQHP
eukprot:gene23189-30401_t